MRVVPVFAMRQRLIVSQSGIQLYYLLSGSFFRQVRARTQLDRPDCAMNDGFGSERGACCPLRARGSTLVMFVRLLARAVQKWGEFTVRYGPPVVWLPLSSLSSHRVCDSAKNLRGMSGGG